MTSQQQQLTADLATNLVSTLGLQRAEHVARQFGWREVVDVILRQQAQVQTRPRAL